MDQKKRKKSPHGRKELDEKYKRKCLKYYLNDAEQKQLDARIKGSIHNTRSEFIRALLLEEGKSARHVNPISFLKEINLLTTEVHKIGVNINQLAKHINEMAIAKISHPKHIEAIEDMISVYVEKQHEIMDKLKEVMYTK